MTDLSIPEEDRSLFPVSLERFELSEDIGGGYVWQITGANPTGWVVLSTCHTDGLDSPQETLEYIVNAINAYPDLLEAKRQKDLLLEGIGALANLAPIPLERPFYNRLQGADLGEPRVRGIDLSEAISNTERIWRLWPDGFTPIAEGCGEVEG